MSLSAFYDQSDNGDYNWTRNTTSSSPVNNNTSSTPSSYNYQDLYRNYQDKWLNGDNGDKNSYGYTNWMPSNGSMTRLSPNQSGVQTGYYKQEYLSPDNMTSYQTFKQPEDNFMDKYGWLAPLALVAAPAIMGAAGASAGGAASAGMTAAEELAAANIIPAATPMAAATSGELASMGIGDLFAGGGAAGLGGMGALGGSSATAGANGVNDWLTKYVASQGAGAAIGGLMGGGSSSTGSGGLGGLLDVLGSKGLGGAVSGLYDTYANNQAANSLKDTMDKITGMYKPGTDEAKWMQHELEARDAAAGRRSQYGTRSVELNSKLAQARMNALSSPAYLALQAGYLNKNLGTGGLGELLGYLTKPGASGGDSLLNNLIKKYVTDNAGNVSNLANGPSWSTPADSGNSWWTWGSDPMTNGSNDLPDFGYMV